MKSKSDLILVIVESFYRWGQKSPRYFRYWQAINFAISAIAFIPLTLSSFNIIATGATANAILTAVAFSTAYGGAMNKLPVSNMEAVPTPFTDKGNAS